MHILHLLISSIFTLFLAHYLITNMQWYSYSLARVGLKHHKRQWHFYFFILPIFVFLAVEIFARYFLNDNYKITILSIAFIVYIITFSLWYKKIDKKLVFTSRVKRYFGFITFFIILVDILLLNIESRLASLLYILAIFFGLCLSYFCEFLIFKMYESKARAKLKSMPSLLIIAITGSYGKTSMKNFIAHTLSFKFNVYRTPRSVNTYKGLLSDINENLDRKCEIYVAEAGARSRGDIAEITALLQPHYAVIGKIGGAHIEYFKSLENTLKAKFELLESKRLKLAFIHTDSVKMCREYVKNGDLSGGMQNVFKGARLKDSSLKDSKNTDEDERSEKINKIATNETSIDSISPFITLYPPAVKNIESTLEETSFSIDLDSKHLDFHTKILGRFNVDNIAAALLLAHSLGLDSADLQKAVSTLCPVEHRLQRIDAGGKIILDDSFNGNLEGMSESIRLCALHSGRKVIITPGLVESDEKSNVELARQIDSVFDLVIITGDLNVKILSEKIKNAKKILLKDKGEMESILAKNLKSGDLVLFANDAPSYI